MGVATKLYAVFSLNTIQLLLDLSNNLPGKDSDKKNNPPDIGLLGSKHHTVVRSDTCQDIIDKYGLIPARFLHVESKY